MPAATASSAAFPPIVLFFLLAAFCATSPAGEPKRLTTDGRIKFTPVYLSPDEIVYVDLIKPEVTALVRLNLADGKRTRLHPDAITQELEPAFSRDGRMCAFLRASGTLSVSLVIRDERNKREAVLPPGGGFCGFRTPSFSPDGKRVIYSFADKGYQDLYSINAQAKDRRQLTTNRGMNYWPSYSPDGKRILFGSTRDGNYEIYTMDARGENIRRLTNSRFQDLRPRFSPDGKRIAFTSSRDGNFEIYVMDAKGANLERITSHPERDDYPSWSPDGKSLIMISEREGSHDVYAVKVAP